MTTTTRDINEPTTEVVPPPTDLGAPGLDSSEGAPAGAGRDTEPESNPLRLAISIGFPTVAAAVMVGGMFTGASARIYAAFAGLLGIGLGVLTQRIRRPVVSNLAVVGGLFAIGVVMVVPSGPGNVASIRSLVSVAAASGNVLRPPVPWTPGWVAIVSWLMGLVGFVTIWVAVALKKPAIALLLPLPVAAIAGISVPKSAQVASGVVVLVLFAIGLGLLASSQSLGETGDRPPVAYEVRKAVKSLPLLAVITVALVFLSKADILFPKPYIDPTQEAQKPKTVPLSEVEDRVLFSVESTITGPWRIGSLDVYDGHDFRLPPFADNRLADVPRSGIVDAELQNRQGVKATFSIAGLGGAVLPTLPNTVGIVAEGPKLAYDQRNANIRVAQGQVQAGLKYSVTAAALPSIEDLEAVTAPAPPSVRKFAEIPIAPPPAAADLIAQAPKTSKWAEFDFLRNHILDDVTATGAGVPKSVDGARVQDMLAGSKEGTPFEIVAAQAMMARWIGLPSRIGYGFDGGEVVDNQLQVRPKNGATFVEVYFPTYKWLPVIGTPKKAKPTVGGDPSQQQFDPSVLPSDDVSVQLFLPVVIPPGSVFFAQLRLTVLIALPVVLLLLLLYITYPAMRKARLRSKRRAAAAEAGSRARIALAYAEFRDFATDFGFDYPTDTPLMFLDRFIEDDEHTEFAWLVTRALWGDLQQSLVPSLANAAEELSRSLQRRLGQAQPTTVRVVSFVSRLSLRHPYAPDTDLVRRRKDQEAFVAA